MKRYLILVLIFVQISFANGQGKKGPKAISETFTSAEKRLQGIAKREMLEKNSWLNNVKFRNAGPAIMSGRVTDLEVNPDNPIEFYAAFASGGVFKTENNGQSFTPIFDNEASITIGDIAVDWRHGEIIWVGTGEVNSSRSSYAGTGVYRSADKGKSWQHLGLPESHHIGKIALHPSDPNTAWVAVLGHLYSANKERGVYQTTDAGRTWKQQLYIDDNTGCVQVQVDGKNPNNVYAAMWYRTRRAWNFEESGESSGIYKSTDGGNTWVRINNPSSGFPTGKGVGRIGMSIYPQNSNIIYAVVDNQHHRPKKEEKAVDDKLTKEQILKMTTEEFLKVEDSKINAYLDEKGFPAKYTAKALKDLLQSAKIQVKDIYDYTEDANSALFDTPIIGAEIYRSTDAGLTWNKTNSDYLDYVFNTYGYYFGHIYISPVNDKVVYTYGVPLLRSEDGGATFKGLDGENMHADHHALWINPNNPKHLINGNDGGINISYDEGKNWIKCNTIPTGQFYAIGIDMDKPYNIYGGLQDNGVWVGPSNYRASTSWQQDGMYPYKFLYGGDGMQVQVDWRDNNTMYSGYQFGNYFRINKTSGESKALEVEYNIGDEKLRWNWQSPIHLSRHNSDVLYFGSQKLHRSMDKGESFKTLSGDLTRGKKDGDVAYGTLTTIDESPMKFGLIYTGSDDGLIHVSKDGGYTYTRISDKLPQNLWVSRVAASAHSEGRVYVSLNGYRNDDFAPYLYCSEDFGTTWKPIGQDLPAEPVNVVREDPSNANIIYVGTDNGLYVSLNRGISFMRWSSGLPNVAVHDLVIHPRDKEIVLGTHGRSIFIADVSKIQQLSDTLPSPYLFSINAVKKSNWGRKPYPYEPITEAKTQFCYFTKSAGPVNFRIVSEKGEVVYEKQDTATVGLNFVAYNYTVSNKFQESYRKTLENPAEWKVAENGNYYLMPGKFIVEVINSEGRKTTSEWGIRKGESRKRE